MTFNPSNLYYKLSKTEGGLDSGANLFIHGIPAPDFVDYSGHTVTRSQSLGGMARHGYMTSIWTWTQLASKLANFLQNIITEQELIDGSGNAILFMTTVKVDASSEGGLLWIDIKGHAHMPNWAPLDQATGLVYNNVSFILNNVEIVNEPSTIMSLENQE